MVNTHHHENTLLSINYTNLIMIMHTGYAWCNYDSLLAGAMSNLPVFLSLHNLRPYMIVLLMSPKKCLKLRYCRKVTKIILLIDKANGKRLIRSIQLLSITKNIISWSVWKYFPCISLCMTEGINKEHVQAPPDARWDIVSHQFNPQYFEQLMAQDITQVLSFFWFT